MTITEKHINLALGIILLIGWFMPLGYNNDNSISLYTIFYNSLFYIYKIWISIIKFIISGGILGLLVSYLISYFDQSILTKKWFKPFLFFSTICMVASLIDFHFRIISIISLNLFFYVYHLLFYYFAYRVLQEIKS